MKENKTKPTKLSVASYLASLPTLKSKAEARRLITLFQGWTKAKPIMWGAMVGFGSYHYKYESGREGDIFATGFALRRSGPTIYTSCGHQGITVLLKDLGKHKLRGSCLYLTDLDAINTTILRKIVKLGLQELKKKYPVILK